jgi:integrase/recombinase XerD
MKTEIVLQRSWLSGAEEWHVRFRYDAEIISKLRTISGARWSAVAKCWLVPGGKSHEELLKSVLRNYTLVWYHEPPESEKRRSDLQQFESSIRFRTEAAREFHQWMIQRRYSINTMKVYAQSIDYFLSHHSHKKHQEITTADTELFLRNEVTRKGLSVSYQRQLINAIKLFYGSYLRTNFNVDLLVLPRKDKKLPKVLSSGEVQSILRSITNQKHRTALLLLYACGLRRSELLDLTISAIDSARGLLHVRMSKGRKDRSIPLPEKLIEVLRGYYKVYRPQHYLFEGQGGPGSQWSAKSLEQVLQRAVKKSGINRRVNLHMLRHSYATHQLESGVNLRYIQEILGHSSPLTTQIYTHVTQDAVRRIGSPAEKLDIW